MKQQFTIKAIVASEVSIDVVAETQEEAKAKVIKELQNRRVEKAGLSERVVSIQLDEATSQTPQVVRITEDEWDHLEDQIRVWFGIVGVFHRDDYGAVDTHQEFRGMTSEMDFGDGNKVLYLNAVRCGDDVIFIFSTCQISKYGRDDIGIFLDTKAAAKEECGVTSFFYRADLLERLRALKHAK